LCRKRLATTRQAIQIFLQALGEKPADCDNERHDHDEDDDCCRPACFLASAPYAFLGYVGDISDVLGPRCSDPT
jgi:hypothetical protein